MGNATRLAVIRRLLRGPCRVGDINAEIGIEQSLLSHHLRVLREAGLVDSRRLGKAVRYSIPEDIQRSPGVLDLGCCELRFLQR